MVADDVSELVAVVIAADDIRADAGVPGGHIPDNHHFANCVPDRLSQNYVTVTAAAGAVWDDVVKFSVDAGFGGLEAMSGIPGSAGATPVQNVGAYGAEVSQVLSAVRLSE